MRVLGIDLGERRIGIAVCDDPELPARALTTLTVTPPTALARVTELVAHEAPTEIVVGLPLRLDGSEGPRARGARKFAAALADATKVPVALQDERLTTSEAHTRRLLSGARGRRTMGERVDAEAAKILLQTYLDARANRWRREEPDP